MTASTPNSANLRASISGSKIFTIMGGVWLAYGLLASASLPVWGGILLPVLAISSVWYVLSRLESRFPNEVEEPAEDSKALRIYYIVNAAQGILIFLAAQVTHDTHSPQFLPVAFSEIVGLHFFALIPTMRRKDFYVLGSSFCLLPVLCLLFLPIDHKGAFIWATVIGLGNGTVLLATVGNRIAVIRRFLAT